MERFSEAVQEQLKNYVYLLVNPLDGKIFYVGKGQGNRVFDHLEEAEKTGRPTDKLDTIREIRRRGECVRYYILRHGLTEEEALLVESVMIDFLTFRDFRSVANISNVQAGLHQWDKGIKTAEELEILYNCPLLDLSAVRHKLLCININHSYRSGESIYEATRKSWRLSKSRADEADYVLSEYRGIVRAVFKVDGKGWQLDPKRRISVSGWSKTRYFFEGTEVDDPEILSLYLNKRLPEKKHGQANPVWYLY